MEDFQRCRQVCGASEICRRATTGEDPSLPYFEFPFQWRTPFCFWCPGLLIKDGVWADEGNSGAKKMAKNSEVTISQERYKELLLTERKLMALEDGGVEDWGWYGETMKEFREDEDRDAEQEN